MQYSRHNYGALLQAAALEHVVRELFPDATVEHIDARPLGMKQRGAWLRTKALLRRYAAGVLAHTPKLPQAGNYEVFSNFRKESIRLTNKTYYEYADFESETWDYDLVIVGSDQVFRIKFLKSRVGIFFLRFLPDTCRRVAYAASFGVDQWEGEGDALLTETVGRDLAKFDAISVRESSGVDICRDTFGLEVTHTLDPTLLIGRGYFDAIVDRAQPKTEVADWSMHCISEDAYLVKEVPTIARKYGKELKSIYFSVSRQWPMPARVQFSSVPEWLAQIRDTKDLVITDSFHCVCFSILFEKDFIVFVSEAKGPGRMMSLLGMLELKDRICTSRETLEAASGGVSPINYTSVREKLAEARAKSFAFLQNALGVSCSLK